MHGVSPTTRSRLRDLLDDLDSLWPGADAIFGSKIAYLRACTDGHAAALPDEIWDGPPHARERSKRAGFDDGELIRAVESDLYR